MELPHVSIAEMPLDERPRERMARGGAAALSDAELLALLIEPGRRGKSALDLARELVADGLLAVARHEWIPGRRAGNLGPARVARVGAALELGRRIAAISTAGSEPLREPRDVAPRLIANYGHRVQETLGAIYLDVRNRIISEREISIGTLSSANAAPRDVLRFALQGHAASLILFHNHPSGDPSPSPHDFAFTRQVIESGRALQIDVLDHLVVTMTSFVSFKDRGWMC